jgi:hypothetical protein
MSSISPGICCIMAAMSPGLTGSRELPMASNWERIVSVRCRMAAMRLAMSPPTIGAVLAEVGPASVPGAAAGLPLGGVLAHPATITVASRATAIWKFGGTVR